MANIDRKKVPLIEDLAIYAQALFNYRRGQDPKDLQLAVLAQRIIIEKSKIYYRSAERIAGLYRQLQKIQDDPVYCEAMAGAVSKHSALAKVWPAYVEVGIIWRKYNHESAK